MPIVELLGVQFDMQLLLKLSLSMAAVLLVSWAYRFYSSRDARKLQLHSKDRPHRQSEELEELAEACQNISPNNDTNSRDQQRRSSITDDDSQMPDSGSGQSAEEDSHQTEIAENKPNMDQDISTEGEILSQREQAELNISNISFGSALNLPSARDGGMVSPTGRRSPCFLQRIEGSMGIGRVLRQDLECQGAYSSFLSKAEIKVEDASLMLEETGNQIVRGKIYDYYVESSSHSIRDSNPMVGQHQGKSSSSQMVEFGGHGSSLKDLPSTLTPIIMHDLVLPQRAVEEPSTLVSPKIKSPTGPILLRKESYLYAAEYSELPTPFPTSTPSHLNHTWASPCEKPISASSLITPTSDGKGLNVWEEPTLENLAGAPFLHLPAEKQESKDLEGLKGKLDLGNCIEVLGLAKKHCQSSLQQAVLQVMSDNYFQVLRDPSLFGRLMASEREQIQRQRMRGRRFVVVADMDPQDWVRNMGGQKIELEQRRTSSTLYYFDDHKDAWHPLCPIPLEVISKACAMCTMDNYLFVAVGCQSTEREMIPSKQVFCFNPATSIWKEISPMNDARPHCKLVALQGYVYAIGGECLSTVERYNPQTDRWTFVAPLPNDTFAVAHRATVCNGEIFVCGGSLRYTLLRYNPKTNMWRASLVVGSKNRSTDMVAVRSFLYRFDINPMLGISVYRYHTVARLWYECSTKHLLHCPAFQCVVMQDTIYCISRQFTLRFMADEISPTFIADDLSVLSAAKGILFPFVLSLPDKKPLQTSV